MTDPNLDERLSRLGTHLDDERSARTGPADTTLAGRAARHRGGTVRRMALAGVAAAAAVVVAIALVVAPDDSTNIAATGTATASVPAGAPAPGELAPHVPAPPAWFGVPAPGVREGAHRTGRWVSLAIGVEDGSVVRSPIWVAVTDGSLQGLAGASTVDVAGEQYRAFSHGDWQVVAAQDGDDVTVVAAGTADIDTLVGVVESVRVERTPDGPDLSMASLPAGYGPAAFAQRHAEDIAERRTVASADGLTGVNEVSDWVRADLAAAASGADYEQISVDGTEAFTGVTRSSTTGEPLRFLMFSPQPGVVIDITTTDPNRTVDDLVELARSVELLPIDQWEAIHTP